MTVKYAESTTKPVFNVWKKITIGTFGNIERIRESLKQAGHAVSNYASEGLDMILLSKNEKDIDVVILSVSELGFKTGATYDDICKRAVELGLMLLPAEAGPKIRLDYTNQPNGERLRIAMNPYNGSDGYLRIFCLKRDDESGSLLYSGFFKQESIWFPESRFLFLSSR
jgi:hypothetical protein